MSISEERLEVLIEIILETILEKVKSFFHFFAEIAKNPAIF